jgi:hypothetical protein
MKTLLRSSKLRMAIWTGLCFSLPLTTWAAPTDCTAVKKIAQAQCDALLSIYNDMGGTSWTNKTDWNETDMPCTYWQTLTGVGRHIFKMERSINNFSGGTLV